MNLKPLFLVAALSFNPVHGEVLNGIKWQAPLDEVKSLYPNATLTSLKPAWLQPDQAFYRVEGTGLSGKMFIAFDDSRPVFQRLVRNDDGTNPDRLAYNTKMADEPVGTALNVAWVRISFDTPVPVGRLKSRYGNGECTVSEDFKPVCHWFGKTLTADLSEDEKTAFQITTVFTKSEKRAQWLRMYPNAPLPQSLRE